MAKEETEAQLLPLRIMFDSGSVTRMRDIEKVFPTRMAKELGMNHSRYVVKLKKPELFTIKQIIKMASLLNLSPERITDVIFKELMLTKSKKTR